MKKTLPLLVILCLAWSLLVVPGSALAYDIGEDVDYDLVFPVDGDHHFADTFWAGRSHGFHTGQDIMALFDRLKKAGHTIILVTHEREIADHAQRTIKIRDGQIESDERRGS